MSNERFPRYSRRLQIKQQLARIHKTGIGTTEKTDNRGESASYLRRNCNGNSNQVRKKNTVEQEFILEIPNRNQDVGKQYQRHNSILPSLYSTGRESPSYTYSLQKKWTESKRQFPEYATRKKEDTKGHQARHKDGEMMARKENTFSPSAFNIHQYDVRAERSNILSFTNNLQQDRISMNWKEDEKFVTEKETNIDQLIIPNNQIQMKERTPPQGLPNIGNTCYANSLLQVLGQTPELYEKVLCTENDASVYHVKRCHVTNAFRRLLQSMNSSNQGPKSFTIAEFMNMVSKRDGEFSIGYQNDCHSFFLTLLSELHDENQGKDLVRVFEIKMVDEFTFDSCKHRDVTDTQIMRSLSIPSESPTVEDGLLNLLYEEIFDELDVPCRECYPNDYNKQGINVYGKTRKAMKFHQLPRVIVLQLGCFQEMSYGNHLHIAKSYKRIGFTKDLTVPQSDGRHATYHLYGVVNHHGSTYGGHYTSYVKHLSPYSDGGHWYYCNDSHVTKSSLSEALASRDAYLLFYKV